MGYFSSSSPLRQVVGHRATALSGPRALLLMAAHPVAFEGFFAHTGALDDPYARLERTARVMNVIAFGTVAEADREDARRPSDAPAGARRAAGGGRPLPGGHAVPGRRPRRCCCGSSLRSPTPPGWCTASTSARSTPPRATRCGRTTGWSARCSASRTIRCRRPRMPSMPTWLEMLSGGDLFVTDRARRAGDRHRVAPAGLVANEAAARARQPGDGRAASAAGPRACTASPGTPSVRSRSTAGPSTSGACSCRCCRNGSHG